MTIEMERDTLTFGGVEFKVRRPAWDEAQHPRDSKGRFIEVGAKVRISRIVGGGEGTVLRNTGGGRIEVERTDGKRARIHRGYLTVVARPDGGEPTKQRSAGVRAAPPEPKSAEIPDVNVNDTEDDDREPATADDWDAAFDVERDPDTKEWTLKHAATGLEIALGGEKPATRAQAVAAARALVVAKDGEGKPVDWFDDDPLATRIAASSIAGGMQSIAERAIAEQRDRGKAKPEEKPEAEKPEEPEGPLATRAELADLRAVIDRAPEKGRPLYEALIAGIERGREHDALTSIFFRLDDALNRSEAPDSERWRSYFGQVYTAAGMRQRGQRRAYPEPPGGRPEAERSGPAVKQPEPRPFADIEAWRKHARAAEVGTLLRLLMNDNTVALADGGQLAVRKEDRAWMVFDATTGAPIMRNIKGGKKGALGLAALLETELIGEDDEPFPWAAPNALERVRAWRSKDGETFGVVGRRLREQFEAGEIAPPEPKKGGRRGLRGDGARALDGAPAEAVGRDEADRAGTVREPAGEPDRAAGGRAGEGTRGEAAATVRPERGVRGDGAEADGGEVLRGVGGAEGDAAAGGGRPAPRRAGRGGGRAGARGRSGDLAEARPGRRLGSGVTPDAPRFQPRGMGDLAPSGERARVAANMEALRTLRRLEAENRPATAEEQTVLARWGGWGAQGVSDIFDEVDPKKSGKYADERAELKRLLSQSEYKAARRNIINAHYTDPAVAQAMWDGLGGLGFTGGRVLEPGSGAGTFIGLSPETVDMVGVELDPVTAGIAKHLYPDANILTQSFADTRMPDGAFDAAIGNVPFHETRLNDPKYNRGGHAMHNHFIIKSLRMTRPGGVVALLTSRYTMDSADAAHRAEMAKYGDLIGAVRLPSGSHRRASGTEVVMDVLVFRRREDPAPPAPKPPKLRPKATEEDKRAYAALVEAHEAAERAKGEAEQRRIDSAGWLESVPQTAPSLRSDLDEGPVAVNRWFLEHPDMVLGDIRHGQGALGRDELKVVDGPADLGAAVRDAFGRIVADAGKRGLLATERDTTETPLPEIVTGAGAREEGQLAEGDQVFERTVTQKADGSGPLDKPRVETTTFTIMRNGVAQPYWPAASAGKQEVAEMRGMMRLRDVASALLAAEATNAEDTNEIDALRGELNRVYDAHVAEHGFLNRFTAKEGTRVLTDERINPQTGEIEPAGTEVPVTRFYTPGQGKFRQTRKSALVYALEKFNGVTQTGTKASIFTKRTVAPRSPRLDADTPADALAISMDTAAEINLRLIADLLHTNEDDARRRLGTLVYDDPDGDDQDRLVPAAEYLSGDVRAKLARARELAELDPLRFEPNVAALEAVVPADLRAEDIDARLGVPWVGAEDVELFLRETLQSRSVTVKKHGSSWEVEGAAGPLGTTVWGMPEMNAIKIAQHALDGKRPKITIEIEKGKRVQSPQLTADAQAKVDEMNDRFNAWLWEDPARKQKLVDRYNRKFNSLVLRQYDTEAKRDMPGLAAQFQGRLYDHQHAAISRIVSEPAVLLAHEVGAGKTLEMIGGTQELRRLGLAKKPAIVVPNHMLEQFSREYLQAYPDANILVATKEQMQGDARREFVARSATGDWDAVIITHSAFERIPMSPEAQEAYIDREMALAREEADSQRRAALTEGGTEKQMDRKLKQIEGRLLAVEERLKKRIERDRDQQGISFEESGIDYVMVDEAHLFKNLMLASNVETVSVAGSIRASDLHMKLDYLRQRNQSNRVVTFATATPLSNSMAEMYTMTRYLRPDLLEEAGVRTFDEWAAMYGRMVSDVEITAAGKFEIKHRFADFVNIPELLRVFHTFADVKTADDLKLPTPPVRGGKTVTEPVDRSPEQEEYIKTLDARIDKLSGGGGGGKEGEDNHLVINTDGRKAALDLRLVGIDGVPNPKLEAAADRIFRIFEENKDRKFAVEHTQAKDENGYLIPGTGIEHPDPGALQIVFCDLSAPGGKKRYTRKNKAGEVITVTSKTIEYPPGSNRVWNVYDELRGMLAERGVPREKVAFIHEARNDAEKARMFEAARTGKIAVLIGSTPKMGVGTNVQNRAVALHHLDCPWRPTDLVQRNGRIVRQGNQNADVQIFNYVTMETLDAKAWDTVARKARFIGQVMTGSLKQRKIEDIGTSAQSLSEVKAIIAKNPHLTEQIRNNSDLEKLARAERAHMFAQQSLRSNAAGYAEMIRKRQRTIAELDAAIAKRVDIRGDQFAMTVARKTGDEWSPRHDLETGQVHEVRKEALAALVERLEDVRSTYRYYQPQVVGRFGGFDLVAERRSGGQGGEFEVHVRLAGIPDSGLLISKRLLESDDHDWLLRQFSRDLNNLDSSRRFAAEDLAFAEEALPTIQRNLDREFTKRPQLDYVRKRAKILANIMDLYSTGKGAGESDLNERRQHINAYDAQLRVLDEQHRALLAADDEPEEELVDEPRVGDANRPEPVTELTPEPPPGQGPSRTSPRQDVGLLTAGDEVWLPDPSAPAKFRQVRITQVLPAESGGWHVGFEGEEEPREFRRGTALPVAGVVEERPAEQPAVPETVATPEPGAPARTGPPARPSPGDVDDWNRMIGDVAFTLRDLGDRRAVNQLTDLHEQFVTAWQTGTRADQEAIGRRLAAFADRVKEDRPGDLGLVGQMDALARNLDDRLSETPGPAAVQPQERAPESAPEPPTPAEAAPEAPAVPEPAEPQPVEDPDDVARRLQDESRDALGAGDFDRAEQLLNQAQETSPTLHNEGDWNGMHALIRVRRRRAAGTPATPPGRAEALPLDLSGPPAPPVRKIEEDDRVRIPAGARSDERNIAYTKPFVMLVDRVSRVLGDRDSVSLGGEVLNDDGSRKPGNPPRRHVLVRRDAVEHLDEPAPAAAEPAAQETPAAPAGDRLVSVERTRVSVGTQLEEAWTARGITWEMEPTSDGRSLYRVEGELLTAGQAADKYLPGGFDAAFGRTGADWERIRPTLGEAPAPAGDAVDVQDVPLVEARPDVLGADETRGQLGMDLGAATEPEGQLGFGLGLQEPERQPAPPPPPRPVEQVPGQIGFEEAPGAPAAHAPEPAPAAPPRPFAERWNTDDNIHTTTVGNLAPGDTIYTRGGPPTDESVKLPTRHGGGLPARSRVERTVDRIGEERTNGTRLIHFTDGTDAVVYDDTERVYASRSMNRQAEPEAVTPTTEPAAPAEPTPAPEPVERRGIPRPETTPIPPDPRRAQLEQRLTEMGIPFATEPGKDRATVVQLPDGVIATRKSKTRDYMHAVVMTEDQHAAAEQREREAESADRYYQAVKEIVDSGDLSRLDRTATSWNGLGQKFYSSHLKEFDPDGRASYLPDWKDKESWERYAPNALKRMAERPADLRAEAAKLRTQPRYGYGVWRWSERRDSAEDAARGWANMAPSTRRFDVVEASVDERARYRVEGRLLTIDQAAKRYLGDAAPTPDPARATLDEPDVEPIAKPDPTPAPGQTRLQHERQVTRDAKRDATLDDRWAVAGTHFMSQLNKLREGDWIYTTGTGTPDDPIMLPVRRGGTLPEEGLVPRTVARVEQRARAGGMDVVFTDGTSTAARPEPQQGEAGWHAGWPVYTRGGTPTEVETPGQLVAVPSPHPPREPDPAPRAIEPDSEPVSDEPAAPAEPEPARGPEPTEAEVFTPDPVPAAAEQTAAEAIATGAPGVFSSRVQIQESPAGTFVTGTAFEDPPEVREALKRTPTGGRAFGWKRTNGRWEYIGQPDERDATVANLRAVLAELDRREAATAVAHADEPPEAPAREFPPTPQQQLVYDAVAAGKDVVVRALAGTGKTTTLLGIAKRHPDKRMLYVAFNRSIKDEATTKFPKNTTVSTSDALAWHALPSDAHRARIMKGEKRPQHVARILGLRYTAGLAPGELANAALKAIRTWAISDDAERSAKHITSDVHESWEDPEVQAAILDAAARAWADLNSPTGQLHFTHEHSMKMWALTDPLLDYDLLFFDEAQDTNSVLAGILRRQGNNKRGDRIQKIVVGDSNQSIYAFRGATDVLDRWTAETDLPLTQSWRFGLAVADAGNRFLQLLDAPVRVQGNPGKDSTIGEIDDPDAILTRTNAGAVGAIAQALSDGKKVATSGDAKELIAFARAAGQLVSGRRTGHPDLSMFASWDEVRDHAEETDDGNLKTFVKLVDTHGADGLLDLLSKLVPEFSKGEQKPDVVISTAHKAKGREWPSVRIHSDFKGPRESLSGAVELPSAEELRLAYVAVTRAEERLDLGSLDWVRYYTAENGGTPDLRPQETPHTAETVPLPDPPAGVPELTTARDAGEWAARFAGTPELADDLRLWLTPRTSQAWGEASTRLHQAAEGNPRLRAVVWTMPVASMKRIGTRRGYDAAVATAVARRLAENDTTLPALLTPGRRVRVEVIADPLGRTTKMIDGTVSHVAEGSPAGFVHVFVDDEQGQRRGIGTHPAGTPADAVITPAGEPAAVPEPVVVPAPAPEPTPEVAEPEAPAPAGPEPEIAPEPAPQQPAVAAPEPEPAPQREVEVPIRLRFEGLEIPEAPGQPVPAQAAERAPERVAVPVVPQAAPEPVRAAEPARAALSAQLDTDSAARWRDQVDAASNALAAAGDAAGANLIRWASDRWGDAHRWGDDADRARTVPVLAAALNEVEGRHFDNPIPDLAGLRAIASGAPDVPAVAPAPERIVGPERPGVAFDPDQPDEAIYGVRGRRGGGRARGPRVLSRTGRAPLYTYQRRNINAELLDTTHPDAVVREAASALRNYQPLTGEHAAALARALRERAADAPARRQRSARTAAARFDVLAASLGIAAAALIDDDDRATAGQFRAGDRVSIPQIGDQAPVDGTVTRAVVRYAGRVVEMEIRDDLTGRTTTRQILKGTPLRELTNPAPARVIEDLDPDPAELRGAAPGVAAELGVGDEVAMVDAGRVVQGRVTRSDPLPEQQLAVSVTNETGTVVTTALVPAEHPVTHLPEPVEVPVQDRWRPATSIQPGDVVWPRGDEDAAFEVETIRREGGLLVMSGRGVADDEATESAVAPGMNVWLADREPEPGADITPAPDPVTDGRPDTVTVDTVRLGDYVRIRSTTGESYTGLVYTLDETFGEDEDTGRMVNGRSLDLHVEGQAPLTYVIFEGDTLDLLERRGPAAGQAVARAEQVGYVAESVHSAFRMSAQIAAGHAHEIAGRDATATPARIADQVAADLADPNSRLRGVLAETAASHADTLAYQLGVRDDDRAAEVADSIAPALEELAARQARDFAAGVRDAADVAAVHRMANAMNGWRGPRPGDPTFRGEAETLLRYAAERNPIVDVVPEPGEVPAPEGAVGERVARLRRALPEDMGKFAGRHVTRTGTPPLSLADLEAGRIPQPTTTTMFVADRAADGGPGAIALRNLDVVRAAGRAVDDAVKQRIRELFTEGDESTFLAPFTDEYHAAKADYDDKARAGETMHADAKRLAAIAAGFRDEREFQQAMNNLLLVGEPPTSGQRGDVTVAFTTPQQRALRDIAREGAIEQRRNFMSVFERREKQALADMGFRPGVLEESRKRFAAAEEALRGARGKIGAARRMATLDVLGELRQFGPRPGSGPRYDRGSGKLVDALRWAEQVFPTDWLDRADALGVIELDERAYGRYSPTGGRSGGPKIILAADNTKPLLPEAGARGRVAIHELARHIERTVPGMLALEQVYLWRRTTDPGGEIGTRTRGLRKNQSRPLPGSKSGSVQAREDDFPSPYTGLEYPDGSKELLATGMEALFAGSDYLDGDDDFRAWLLGVLATAGSPMPPERPATPEVAVNAPEDPLAGVVLADLSDLELSDLMGRYDDDAVLARIEAEFNRRDGAPAQPANTPEQDRIDELMAAGYSFMDAYAEAHGLDPADLLAEERAAALDVERQAGETREKAMQRLYAEWIDMEVVAASNATRGNLLKPASDRAGMDPRQVFSGPRHIARAHASEELARWWESTGRRKTYTEFKADMLARRSDLAAAEQTRQGGNDRDFGL